MREEGRGEERMAEERNEKGVGGKWAMDESVLLLYIYICVCATSDFSRCRSVVIHLASTRQGLSKSCSQAFNDSVSSWSQYVFRKVLVVGLGSR